MKEQTPSVVSKIRNLFVRLSLQPQERHCPSCGSIVYTPRHRLCGACGEALPEDCLFTVGEARMPSKGEIHSRRTVNCPTEIDLCFRVCHPRFVTICPLILQSSKNADVLRQPDRPLHTHKTTQFRTHF